ncbi:hypothetical protein HWV62_13193 [Athelia sp. TMB]|nr:hypothetical protein HWV62_13193 [Athelia sp. TMB]
MATGRSKPQETRAERMARLNFAPEQLSEHVKDLEGVTHFKKIEDSTQRTLDHVYGLWQDYATDSKLPQHVIDIANKCDPPAEHVLKGFVDYCAAATPGRLEDAANENTIYNKWGRFTSAWYRRSTIRIPPNTCKQVVSYMDSSDFKASHGLSTKSQVKHVATTRDIELLLEYLWQLNTFRSFRERMNYISLIHLLALTNERPSAIVPTLGRKDKPDVITYGQFQVRMIPNEDATRSPHIFIFLQITCIKGHMNNESKDKWVLFYPEPADEERLNCPVTALLSVFFDDDAFLDIHSVEELLHPTIPVTHGYTAPFRPELKGVSVFRQVQLNIDKRWVSHPTKAIGYNLLDFNLIKWGINHSERWRNIYLMLPLPLLHSLSSVKNRLPNLELLQFDFCNHGNRPLLVEPIDIFAHAPRLQDFSAGVNVDRASLHIPWSQLRTIKSLSDDHSPQSMLNLLKTAPYIERCRMKIEGNASGPSLTPGQAPGSVQLSNIQYLTAVFESEDPTSFFTILDIPNIRELSLATDMGWGPLISTLTSICSQPSLEKLALMSMMWYDSPDVSDGSEDSDDSGDTNDTNDTDDSDDSDDSDEFNKALFRRLRGNDLMQILKAAKHVQELEVPECNPRFFTADFMKRFGQLRSSGTPILCPNLQKLQFRYSEKMDLEPLGEALLSRCSSTSHPTLRDVVVLCWDAKRASITKALQSSSWWIKLRDVGIDMRVSRFENYEQWW